MGQSSSFPSKPFLRSPSCAPRRRRSRPSPASTSSSSSPMSFSAALTPFESALSAPDLPRDHTSDLPDDCLALVFHALAPGDRKRVALVCRRWLAVEAQSRYRISIDARSALLEAVPSLFTRYDAVTKLALKCDRRAESIGDEALALISVRCPLLTRLKLRACRQVTDAGMAALATNCRNLRKLSCGSCAFGAKGITAVVAACPSLEELSIKRLRGLTEASTADGLVIAHSNSSLKSICLKELYNGQCLTPLIVTSIRLKTLKLFRCSGDWDKVLEEVGSKVPGLSEVHLEKLQVSDRGLGALTACVELEILHLVKTPECTDKGLSFVAESCRLLRKIHIDGWKANRIGDVGLSVIARRCPNLQELVLIGVNPTSVSLGLIAENCKNLERLALCSSETFGDAEISCIASKCVSLKKLCIKGCPVSDQGMEALAEGCPNLVKVKVKKCRGVTMEGADWLRSSRGMLAVNLDVDSPEMVEQADASASENGMQDNGVEPFPGSIDQLPAADLPSSSNARSGWSKARLRFFTRTNFMSSTFRKLSFSSSSQRRQ